MARKVQALDENTIRKIAAGEVVERPASVVKELLENAVDACGLHITLEILEGGKKMIRVSDNGCGMSKEDALLSLERHTTSKIRSVNDLENLTTFGFRGEALPSIAAVSKMTLSTQSPDEPIGADIKVEGGKIISKKECGRAPGTSVQVNELFFNVPARLKFLKSEGTERGKIFNTFEETAIAHPEIAFRFKSENRTVYELAGRTELLQRITDLWEGDFTNKNLVRLALDHPFIRIEGWVSSPQFHQPTKSYQIFYVNNRPIVSRSITHALYESYRDCLPAGRHPAAVIFLTLHPSLIDVNVHPSKREVRFRNEHQIYELLTKEIKSKRNQFSSSPQFFGTSGVSVNPLELNVPSETVPGKESSIPSQGNFAGNGKPVPEYRKNYSSPPVAFPETPRVLTQFHSLYVIAEQGANLVIVDQHAAGERILYEQFRKALLEKEAIPVQPLLIPLIWNVTPAQAELLKDHQPTLQKLGFMLEPFGEKTFRITESPAIIPEAELKHVMDAIIASVENEGQPTLAVEEKIMTAACRAAIKASDSLTPNELNKLLQALARCENPHTCPHGRPTTLTISRQELDKKFGRV